MMFDQPAFSQHRIIVLYNMNMVNEAVCPSDLVEVGLGAAAEGLQTSGLFMQLELIICKRVLNITNVFF